MQFSKSNLKALRSQRGMTQPDLAAAVGVHYLTIGVWEGNRHKTAPKGSTPSPDNFAKLCHVLGCAPEELLEQPDASAKETADHREGHTKRSREVNSDGVRSQH